MLLAKINASKQYYLTSL